MVVAEPEVAPEVLPPPPKLKRAPRKPRAPPEPPAPPNPPERAPRKPRAAKAPPAPQGLLLSDASLLDIIRAGLEHSKTKHKLDKVQRYDAMFAGI